METFIISYMIANEVVGVVMAVGFVKYLRKSGFFIQRKIAKWRSKKPYSDVEFWTAFNLLEEALKKAKSEGKKELYIASKTTLDDAWRILQSNLIGDILTKAPFYVVKNLYRPAYQEMIDWYGIEIKHIY
ncbi:Uncharacterised protein [Chlamydia trachomatis]|nr:Uncharacterised protein [Chlamydia trachomatis]